ncbi:hypothetical protein pb186bvf_012447 [Paramecium bursaria]
MNIHIIREKFRYSIRKRDINNKVAKMRFQSLLPTGYNQELENIKEDLDNILKNQNELQSFEQIRQYYDDLVVTDKMSQLIKCFKYGDCANKQIVYEIFNNLKKADQLYSSLLFDSTEDFLQPLIDDIEDPLFSNYSLQMLNNIMSVGEHDEILLLIEDDKLQRTIIKSKYLSLEQKIQQFEQIERLSQKFCITIINTSIEFIISQLPQKQAIVSARAILLFGQILSDRFIEKSLEIVYSNDLKAQRRMIKTLAFIENSHYIEKVVNEKFIQYIMENYQQNSNKKLKRKITFLLANYCVYDYIIKKIDISYLVEQMMSQEQTIYHYFFYHNMIYLQDAKKLLDHQFFDFTLNILYSADDRYLVVILEYIMSFMAQAEQTSKAKTYQQQITSVKKRLFQLMDSKNDMISMRAALIHQIYIENYN